jgi:hypothetical protein
MKKRVFTVFLSLFLAIMLLPVAFAENTGTPSSSSGIRIFVDNRQIRSNVSPYIMDGRTLIPIRVVTEALGADVDWDGVTKTLKITRAAKEIIMVIGEEYATVNGERIKLDAAPSITGGSTFLPLRFVSEQFSQKVDWDSTEQAVRISEDMSFAKEDANIKEWMLGCGAILAKVNKIDPYSIGMNPRTSANVNYSRRMLSGSWNCEDREDVISAIENMTDGGHAELFEYDAELANSFSDAEFKALLEMSNEVDRFMWRYVKGLSEKWGDRGIRAWDWFRMFHLAGWGYLAGYLELEEAYILVEPVAQRLRDTFTSWDEATENYMDGYAYWSRTDITEENTSYRQRLQIYEDLKAAQETDGLLFDPNVWSQPVKGAINQHALYPQPSSS